MSQPQPISRATADDLMSLVSECNMSGECSPRAVVIFDYAPQARATGAD